MYYSTAVAGRTRGRRALVEKQNLQNTKPSKKRNGAGVFGSNCVNASVSFDDDEEECSSDFDGKAHSEPKNFCKPDVDPILVDYGDDEVFMVVEQEEGSVSSVEVVDLTSDGEDFEKEVVSHAKDDHETSGLKDGEAKNLIFDAIENSAVAGGSVSSASNNSGNAYANVMSNNSELEAFSKQDAHDGSLEHLSALDNEVENPDYVDYIASGVFEAKRVEDVERTADKSTVEKNKVDFGAKRKKMYGLDILVDHYANQEHKCAAQRTRSHFSSKLAKRSLKMGTFSQPLCVDDEEEEQVFASLSEQGRLDDDDDGGETNHISRKRKATRRRKSSSYDGISNSNGVSDDNHGELGFSNGNDDDIYGGFSDGEGVSGSDADKREGTACVQKLKIHKADMGKPTRRNCITDMKDFDVFKILEDSIYCNEQTSPKVTETILPLNFSFVEEPIPLEKSEFDKELDALWAEFDKALNASQQNSVPADQVEFDQDQDKSPTEVNIATLCQRGRHQLILDEEIGLRCAFCSHVGLEIKYIVPPFCKIHLEKSDRRDFCAVDHVDHSFFSELQHGCDDCCGYSSYNDTGTVWDIIPGVKKGMYPHQCEAFEFLWRNLAGGIFLDKLKEKIDFPSGSGCIISHAPGTGKTRLTIVFLQTYMKLYPTCRPMIIAPSSMLLTWEEEFEKWKVGIPFHNLNKPEYSGMENEVAISLLKKYGCNMDRTISIRLAKLYSWKKDRSILGISYRLFEKLAGQSSNDKDLKKVLLELPGLLVLDEGHTPRNAQSLIWKALSEIQTKRRIILSGTPFQNNFDELYNTLRLVRPKFAEWNSYGDRVVFDERRGLRKNKTRGKWGHLIKSYGEFRDDSARCEILKEIRGMIVPFVHVHRGNILQESLPGLRKLVVVLKPTQWQKNLLENIQKERKNHLQGSQGYSNVLKLEHLESLTAVHPLLLPVSTDKEKLERVKLNPEDGVKTNFLMELIRLSELMNEKVLVFSQFIDPLTFLADLLKSHFSWTQREVLQMHGGVDVKLRQASIKAFNDPTSKVRVLLASTKACFEGINLVGASRVVLLDVVWNPSVERQAVSRAYRLGQKKIVYTYHLITSGTRDEEKCERQAEKDKLSDEVFFYPERAGHQQNFLLAEVEDEILEEMVQHEKFRHIFEKITTNKESLF